MAAVFAWHLALAFLHKRSLKKFALTNVDYTPAPLMGESKGGKFGGPTYGEHAALAASGRGSTLGLGGAGTDGVSGAAAGGLNSAHDRTRSMINSGLFFSPTAEVMNSAQGANNHASDSLTSTMGSSAGVGIVTNMKNGAPRASVYMPAGYYGGSQGGAPSMMSGGRSVRHMSMSNISMSGVPYGGNGAASVMSGGGAGGSGSNNAGLRVPTPGTGPGNSRLSQHMGGGEQQQQQQQQRESVRAPSAYLDDFLGASK